MLIDGKMLADSILAKLGETVSTLKEGNIIPTLAVILVGDDPGSVSFIKQKQKAADRIGAKLILEQLPDTTTRETLQSAVAHYNNDRAVHGLIIQRPVPKKLGDVGDILNSINPASDVDGFIPNSPFEVPVSRAVLTILEFVHRQFTDAQLIHDEFKPWLTDQAIAIVGRGDTAGKPIAAALAKYDCATSIIHSRTANPTEILKKATVIISCVGKEKIIAKSAITPGVILISVGIWRDVDGKVHGDYDPDDIADTASFYTPTPGGVGPVNVACLMHNLVDAAVMTVT